MTEPKDAKTGKETKDRVEKKGLSLGQKIGLVFLVAILVPVVGYVILLIQCNFEEAKVCIPVVSFPVSMPNICYMSPVIVLILVSFAVGLVLAWLVGGVSGFRVRRKAARLERRVRQLESEIERLGRLAASTPAEKPLDHDHE